MKRLLLLACMIPILGFAQSTQSENGAAGKSAVSALGTVTPATLPKQDGSGGPRALYKVAGITFEPIGQTTFDVQTNAAMPRKVVSLSGGKLFAVWTYSKGANGATDKYLDRGTNTNYYNGTSWGGSGANRVEPNRCGYGCVVSFIQGGKEKVMIVSHRAESSGDTAYNNKHTGGLVLTKFDNPSSTSFTQTFEKIPYGPMWPRAAASGNYVHIIAAYQSPGYASKSKTTYIPLKDTVRRNGVYHPVVYYRYNLANDTFDVKDIAIPGYDSTVVWGGNSDDYSVDARDSFVAVVFGGLTSHVLLYKSADYGNTWKRTIVDTFMAAPYNGFKHDTFATKALGDTTLPNPGSDSKLAATSNDGSVHVTLDKDGVAHVFYSNARLACGRKDGGFVFWPGTDGVVYYNDKDKVKKIAGFNNTADGLTGYAQGTFNNSVSKGTAAEYSNLSASTMANATISDSNHLYMVYVTPDRMQTSASNANFRHILCTFTKDKGKTWSAPIDLSYANPDELDEQKEHVYPSLTRDCKDGLDMVWQRDDEPGLISLNSNNTNVKVEIVYTHMPLSVIQDYRAQVGIQSNGVYKYSLSPAYPNPASNNVKFLYTARTSENVNVKLTDMMGKEVYAKSYGIVPEGASTLELNVSDFSKGVYFYTVSTGTYTMTQKLIVK